MYILPWSLILLNSIPYPLPGDFGICCLYPGECFGDVFVDDGFIEVRPQGANFNRITLIALSDTWEGDFVLFVKPKCF